MRTVCNIDTQDLMEEFTKHAGYYAWYSTVLALYESRKKDLEFKIDVKYAELDLEVRASYTPEEKKSLKEKNIDSRVTVNGDYMALQEEYLSCSSVVRRLVALVKGLEVKSNMLQQVGARARKEMELDSSGR